MEAQLRMDSASAPRLLMSWKRELNERGRVAGRIETDLHFRVLELGDALWKVCHLGEAAWGVSEEGESGVRERRLTGRTFG